MSATNHKADAEALTGINASDWRNGDVSVAQQTEALVHATLYLAEQQRIANLIAVSALFTAGEVTPDPEFWTPAKLRKLGSDLTEGLGL